MGVKRPRRQAARVEETQDCPCGSGRPHAACCGPYLARERWPETAEALMRSRYCAYVMEDGAWLRESWHPATRHQDVGLDPAVRWLGLKVLAAEAGGPEDERGSVQFVARYKIDGRAYRLHEISHFQRRDGRWVYVSGDPQ